MTTGFVSLLNLFFGLSSYQHAHRLWVRAGFGLPVFFGIIACGLLVQRALPVLRSSGHWQMRHRLLLKPLITHSISRWLIWALTRQLRGQTCGAVLIGI